MASPSPAAQRSSKEKVAFRFCRECSNMLYPHEDKENNVLMFRCRTCHAVEPATNYCVFRNNLAINAGETAGVTTDVGSDPTVRTRVERSETPLSLGRRRKMGEREKLGNGDGIWADGNKMADWSSCRKHRSSARSAARWRVFSSSRSSARRIRRCRCTMCASVAVRSTRPPEYPEGSTSGERAFAWDCQGVLFVVSIPEIGCCLRYNTRSYGTLRRTEKRVQERGERKMIPK